MSSPDFYKIAVEEALDHPDLPEANRLADAFRLACEGMRGFDEDAYRLAYAFYAGVGWEELTDRERLAFLMWQEGIT